MLPEEYLVAAAVMVMVLMVAAQVASRYFLHVSLSHTEEVVRYLFVWATVLGASAAARRGRHLSISSGGGNRPGFFHSLRRFTIGAGALVFTAVLVVWGMRVVLIEFNSSQKTAALGFPMWIVGLAIPACGILIFIRLIQASRDGGGGR